MTANGAGRKSWPRHPALHGNWSAPFAPNARTQISAGTISSSGGDNLLAPRELLADQQGPDRFGTRGKTRLIYIDPPFATRQEFTRQGPVNIGFCLVLAGVPKG
jgi:hypothetical protein